jgi:hypothetical protein
MENKLKEILSKHYEIKIDRSYNPIKKWDIYKRDNYYSIKVIIFFTPIKINPLTPKEVSISADFKYFPLEDYLTLNTVIDEFNYDEMPIIRYIISYVDMERFFKDTLLRNQAEQVVKQISQI